MARSAAGFASSTAASVQGTKHPDPAGQGASVHLSCLTRERGLGGNWQKVGRIGGGKRGIMRTSRGMEGEREKRKENGNKARR